MPSSNTSRTPKIPLFRFKRRALVPFAIDTDEVSMATRGQGFSTYFLPFNRGCDNGAGNPPASGTTGSVFCERRSGNATARSMWRGALLTFKLTRRQTETRSR